jgi:nicotinic acid phosphoribosyltransferase
MFKIFNTDYYQFTMSLAYLIADKANETTGFESFVRNIKPKARVDLTHDIYIFQGNKDLSRFIHSVKKEIQDPSFFEKFWAIVEPSVPVEKRIFIYKKAKENFNKMDKTFEYTIMNPDTILYPFVPVFQYKGPKMFGQMIETSVTNIVNGSTGFAGIMSDLNNTGALTFQDKKDIIRIMTHTSPLFDSYLDSVTAKAIEYRKATTKPLFEAAFRRSPDNLIANLASKIAINAGWNGSSNVSSFLNGMISLEDLGGSMAHAFVMSFETEIEAFRVWHSIFPTSTFLVDTYDTLACIKMIIRENLKPAAVRIDSGDLKAMSFAARKILDEAGWTDVKIFISGDITPEILIEFENENVPFDMTMAGTKFVNIGFMEYINAGFVYKIVEYERDGVVYYPEKKAEGKGNYPGLKKISLNSSNVLNMTIGSGTFGFPDNLKKIDLDTSVVFNKSILDSTI